MGIQNLVALLKVLKLYMYYFLKFWEVKICGLHICWYPKHVGTQKCGYNEISNFVGRYPELVAIIRYRHFRDVTTQSVGT